MNSDDKNRIAEEWLDAGLKELGEIEPRAGLEMRILANLRTATTPASTKFWPVLAGALVLVAVALILHLYPPVSQKTPSERTIASSQPAFPQVSNPAVIAGANTETPAYRTERAKLKRLHFVAASVQATPRLESFPSPAPLSEQEMMLAAYVKEKPQEAEMVARVRADLLKQDLVKFEQTPGTPDDVTRQNQD